MISSSWAELFSTIIFMNAPTKPSRFASSQTNLYTKSDYVELKRSIRQSNNPESDYDQWWWESSYKIAAEVISVASTIKINHN